MPEAVDGVASLVRRMPLERRPDLSFLSVSLFDFETVRDALRALQQRRQEDALKLKALRAQVKAGFDALDRGDFVDVDDVELDGYLETLTTPSGKRAG